MYASTFLTVHVAPHLKIYHVDSFIVIMTLEWFHTSGRDISTLCCLYRRQHWHGENSCSSRSWHWPAVWCELYSEIILLSCVTDILKDSLTMNHYCHFCLHLYVNLPQDEFGATPLMIACAMNHTEVVSFLLESGANVNYLSKVFKSYFTCSDQRYYVSQTCIVH